MAENFTPEEIEEFKECFGLYDRDGDGLISTEQLKLVMRSLEQCPTQTDISQISKSLGKNKVNFPEFLDILLLQKSQKQKNWKEEIFEAFKIYTNGNSSISMVDLKHIMMRTGERLTQQEFDYMLHQAGISKNSMQVNYRDLARAFAHI